jgi:hypothetical protein
LKVFQVWRKRGLRRMMEGVNSTMIYYKNFGKCHSVLPYNNNKKDKKKKRLTVPLSTLRGSYYCSSITLGVLKIFRSHSWLVVKLGFEPSAVNFLNLWH